MNNALKAVIRDAVRSSEVGTHVLTSDFDMLQIGGPRGTSRKVSFLIFNRSVERPFFVVKTSRNPDRQSQLRQEFEILDDLGTVRQLAGQVPCAVACFEHQGQTFSVETCVSGIALATLLRRRQHLSRRNVNRDLQRVLQWLRQFQNATRSPDRHVTLDMLLAAAAPAESAADMPDALRTHAQAWARRLDGFAIPLTGCHGDPWPGNVFFDRHRTGMIDWDGFQRDACPADDLLHAVLTYAQTYPWRGWKWIDKTEAFRWTFLTDNWWSRIASAQLGSVFSELDIPWDAGDVFLASLLTRRSRRAKDGGTSFWDDLLAVFGRHYEDSIFRRPPRARRGRKGAAKS